MKPIRVWLSLAALFLGASPARSNDAPEPFTGGSSFLGTPKIQFEEPIHKFGHVTQGTPVNYKFKFKNVGTGDLIIFNAKGSCGCTAALVSTGPYHPGQGGFIDVSYDNRGKFGTVFKDVRVDSNDPASPSMIALEGMVTEGNHPAMAAGEVLFKGSCAECHSIPAKGKSGKELYEAVCAICHDPHAGADSRKTIAATREKLAMLDHKQLKKIISEGIPETSMPGFSAKRGGPLSKSQVKSLLEYLESLNGKK